MKVVISITRTKGKDYDDKITMEDITSGRLDVSPLVNVRISAEGMTEEECAQYVEKEMQKAIEEIDLSGTYGLYFYTISEKSESVEASKRRVYSDVIFWYQKGENDGR